MQSLDKCKTEDRAIYTLWLKASHMGGFPWLYLAQIQQYY